MRIIHEGSPPAPRKEPWIYEQDITCPNCATVFRLEPGDVFLLSRSLTDPTAAVKCPMCHTKFDVRPFKPWPWPAVS